MNTLANSSMDKHTSRPRVIKVGGPPEFLIFGKLDRFQMELFLFFGLLSGLIVGWLFLFHGPQPPATLTVFYNGKPDTGAWIKFVGSHQTLHADETGTMTSDKTRSLYTLHDSSGATITTVGMRRGTRTVLRIWKSQATGIRMLEWTVSTRKFGLITESVSTTGFEFPTEERKAEMQPKTMRESDQLAARIRSEFAGDNSDVVSDSQQTAARSSGKLRRWWHYVQHS